MSSEYVGMIKMRKKLVNTVQLFFFRYFENCFIYIWPKTDLFTILPKVFVQICAKPNVQCLTDFDDFRVTEFSF